LINAIVNLATGASDEISIAALETLIDLRIQFSADCFPVMIATGLQCIVRSIDPGTSFDFLTRLLFAVFASALYASIGHIKGADDFREALNQLFAQIGDENNELLENITD
jgi:ADP-dependent phosphofructokinase/glucokinase